MADHSQGKHTQIVQVLLPAPEPKKTVRRRRRVARTVAEPVSVPTPAPFNGYTPVYPSFTPGMPSFSPSIDITTGSQYPPEPPAGTAAVPPIETEPIPKPTKKKSKLKGIIKTVGRGIAAAVEAIGEQPTQTTPGITPIMPEPIIPEFIPPEGYIPPTRVEEPAPYQMYQPTPYLLTGEPMTQEAEIQTEPEVIFGKPTTREMGTITETPIAQWKANLTDRQLRFYNKMTISKLKDRLMPYYSPSMLDGVDKRDLFTLYLNENLPM